MAISAVLLTVAALGPAGAQGGHAATPRTIEFSGYTWVVKSSTGKVGPGPNNFSSSPSNVWVDALGRLHLEITRAKGRWYCAEVVNTLSLGRGTYAWTLDSRVDNLDQNVVLGLFTWNDDPAYNHREIDVEFARFGNTADPTNGQYVVQPWDHEGNLLRITQPAAPTSSHGFTWSTDTVTFTSSSASPSHWTYAGPEVPAPGGENARMNLWLYHGLAPAGGREVEVVIRSFSFSPSP